MSLSERLYKYAYKQNNRKIAIKNLHSKCLYQKDSIYKYAYKQNNRKIAFKNLQNKNVSIRKTQNISVNELPQCNKMSIIHGFHY